MLSDQFLFQLRYLIILCRLAILFNVGDEDQLRTSSTTKEVSRHHRKPSLGSQQQQSKKGIALGNILISKNSLTTRMELIRAHPHSTQQNTKLPQVLLFQFIKSTMIMCMNFGSFGFSIQSNGRKL